VGHFCLLEPDSEYGSGSRSTDLIESGSNPDPDPKPWFGVFVDIWWMVVPVQLHVVERGLADDVVDPAEGDARAVLRVHVPEYDRLVRSAGHHLNTGRGMEVTNSIKGIKGIVSKRDEYFFEGLKIRNSTF
jgi:hypothetical protein